MIREHDWKYVLSSWRNGNYLKYPKTIKNRFVYETNICDNKFANEHYALFIESSHLSKIKKQNFGPFIEYIGKALDKHVTSFYDFSGNVKIILPIPKKDKDFCTMKDFMDNAPESLQVFFWNYVSKEIILFLKKHDNVCISTDQGNINYFHLKLYNHDSHP